MFDLVPFILKREEEQIHEEITNKHLSVIFDGTSRLGEAMAILCALLVTNGTSSNN